MGEAINSNQVSVTVQDRITCNPGDVITLWIYTSAPAPLDGLPNVAVPSGGVGVDGLMGVTNYMSVTHASFW